MLEKDVEVEVNLTKLYHKEKQVYVVKCVDINYYKVADDVRIEKTPDEHALFITSNGVTDKIFCKGGYTLGQNKLSLLTQI